MTGAPAGTAASAPAFADAIRHFSPPVTVYRHMPWPAIGMR